ncbi:MAG TPA: hypothetical protein VMU66_10290, partial [Gaiellales bacterium]|nr:hypothetical protein [Gaiellales bacterium]
RSSTCWPGRGLSWRDGAVYEVRAGDCLVHLAGGPAHTLRAGDDGLDVIVFGMRVPVEACLLPRAGVAWLGRPGSTPAAPTRGRARPPSRRSSSRCRRRVQRRS